MIYSKLIVGKLYGYNVGDMDVCAVSCVYKPHVKGTVDWQNDI